MLVIKKLNRFFCSFQPDSCGTSQARLGTEAIKLELNGSRHSGAVKILTVTIIV